MTIQRSAQHGAGEQDRLVKMQSKETHSLRKALGKITHQTYYVSSFYFKKNVKLRSNYSTFVSSFFFSLNWAVAMATQEQITRCLQWIADIHFSSTGSCSELLKKVILNCCFSPLLPDISIVSLWDPEIAAFHFYEWEKHIPGRGFGNAIGI